MTIKLEHDESLINDFRGEFDDAIEHLQAHLIELEADPYDMDELNALFRVMHSIKSNLRMMQLNATSEFVHRLEELLEDMRAQLLSFDQRFSDIILLCLERVKDVFEASFECQQEMAEDLQTLGSELHKIHDPQTHTEQAIAHVLKLLDSEYSEQPVEIKAHLPDMDFFRRMATFMQERHLYSEGISERVLDMSRQINGLVGSPVDDEQLEAAVYIHDLGMNFLPPVLLNKPDPLEEEERKMIETHPQLGANLLGQLNAWDEAAQIVMQHHERVDGTGYPAGLKGDQICAGARILAIVDTFDAMTQQRAYREHKRSILRVVAEINNLSGKQFDPLMVDGFNQWVRKNYVKK